MKRSEQLERWERCQTYIRRTRTLPDAMALARTEGFAANTSVWLAAMSKLLEQGYKLR